MSDEAPKTRPPIVINEKQLDQQLRLHAMQMAVKFAGDQGLSEINLVDIAKEIYEFIKGETK